MKNEKIKQNLVRLVVISIFAVFLTTSVNSAIVIPQNFIKKDNSSPINSGYMENYYEWIDEFTTGEFIDTTGGKSYGYEIIDQDGGYAQMKFTCPYWRDPAWTRMQPITVDNNGPALEDWAVHFNIPYDPDMDPDFDDIRFKHEDSTTIFLDYWIEDYVQSNQVSVWVKVPELSTGTNDMYLFYGNPSAQDESNFAEVFTVWDYWEENDYKISIHMNNEGAWDPDVAYADYSSDGRFLVAWEEGTSVYIQQEIRATLFDSDGNVEKQDFEIYTDNTIQQFRNENPSIAYGEDGSDKTFFVAWQRWQIGHPTDDQTLDIKGRLVSPNGVVSSNVINICNENNCQADPNVEFDTVNKQFLVVWEDARDGMNDYDIWAQLYDCDGNTVGSAVRICNDANSQCEPWAAFDPINEQYFIVWEDGITPNNGPFRIKGGLFDESLNDLWTGTIAEPSSYPNDDIDYNFPCVEFDEDSERFLVTWNDGDISDGDWRGNVWGKIFDTSGNVQVGQFTIKSGNWVRTDIVPYLSEAFFVSYDDNGDIFGKIVSHDGDLLSGDVQISVSQGSQADWANLALGGNKIFAVWEDERIQTYTRPDAYGNMLNLNMTDSSDITYSFDDEQQLVLEAQITSVDITFENLEKWHEFRATFDGTITFDLLDTNCNIIIEDISSGQDLSGITQDPLRLRAHFTRSDPRDSPILHNWSILYEGLDTDPPVTWLDNILGTPGRNGWYVSTTVTVFFGARDYPEDTGSGVNVTKYKLNGGNEHIYDVVYGLNLTTEPPDFWNIWNIEYWSIDNAGNAEYPPNTLTIKADSQVPVATIIEPSPGEHVHSPFECIVEVEENAEMDCVVFDMWKWGTRPNLPAEDKTPPYSHIFDQKPLSRPKNTQPLPGGAAIKIRAWPYDMAGTPSEPAVIEIYIVNWGNTNKIVTVKNFHTIFSKLNLGIAFDDKLDINIFGIEEDVDQMKFVATRVLTKKQTTLWDNDLSDGCSAIFDLPTGFYKVNTYSYKEGLEVSEENILRVFFLNT